MVSPAGHSQVRMRQALADPADQVPRCHRVGTVGRTRGQQVAGRGGRGVDALEHAYILNDGRASRWLRSCCFVTSVARDLQRGSQAARSVGYKCRWVCGGPGLGAAWVVGQVHPAIKRGSQAARSQGHKWRRSQAVRGPSG